MTSQNKIIPVVLCGGVGSRLWPLSRERSPKQFHPLMSTMPLLHDTLARAEQCTNTAAEDIITVTSDVIKKETIHQLADYDPDTVTNMISEPISKNTAAAIAYAALHARSIHDEDTILWIMPSDHYIEDLTELSLLVEDAANTAKNGYLVTFGMSPTRPDTGYGYIKKGQNFSNETKACAVEKFVEKPNSKTATDYIKDGSYLWNSGMFIGTIKNFIKNFKEHCPDILNAIEKDLKIHQRVTLETYTKLPTLPFDIAIMEKTNNAAVIPCDIGWSDVGSWESLWNLKDKDKNGNVISGRVAAIDSENCFIQSNNLLVATMGLRDIVVVENGDSILIADKKNNHSMAHLVKALKHMNSSEAIDPPAETRPWGKFKILSQSDGYKVKELLVRPAQRLSHQTHKHRCEFWTVISGTALVTINDEERTLTAQENAFIPLGASHRLENIGTDDLIIVEVQCGSYLNEDDIVRLDDIYGRMETA